MERSDVEKILSEQLQLLAEVSKSSWQEQDLPAISMAMIALAHEIFPMEMFSLREEHG